jgi:hypothetical protein
MHRLAQAPVLLNRLSQVRVRRAVTTSGNGGGRSGSTSNDAGVWDPSQHGTPIAGPFADCGAGAAAPARAAAPRCLLGTVPSQR